MRNIPSPNYNDRPDKAAITMLVLHYTGMPTAQAALDRMCNPKAEVSAHYMVDEDGSVIQLVEERHRAWHAGVSAWRGQTNINDISVGVEIVNPGHEFGYRAFPKKQMEAVAALSSEIIARHGIRRGNIVGHSDIAPMRKEDPGELFDWEWLAQQGIGFWPNVEDIEDEIYLSPSETGEDVMNLQQALHAYGYGLTIDGQYGEETKAVVTAFQRRFHPELLDGVWGSILHEKLGLLLSRS